MSSLHYLMQHVNSKLGCHHTRKLLAASISQFMTLLIPPTAHDYA